MEHLKPVDDIITILHLSDFHARLGEQVNQQIRVDALLEDLGVQGLDVDIVLMTGDLAYSGKKEEYQLAQTVLLDPLLKQLNLKRDRLLLIPGNHDVDRAAVDELAEDGFRNRIDSSQAAEQYLNDKTYGFGRLKGYHKFVEQYQGLSSKQTHIFKQRIKGLDIGFACLNSAWRCSGIHDHRNLFLTEKQINPAVQELQDCDLKIALVHHPFDWLHPSEDAVVVPDIKQQFDMVTTGHLHTPLSQGEMTPVGQCLSFSAPAIFDDRRAVGYNIYQVSFSKKTVSVKYRKFVRDRREFDANTDHARNGEKTFPLAINSLAKFSQGVLAQRIAQAGTIFETELKKHLGQFQSAIEPIYVTPPVRKLVWKEGHREPEGVVNDFIEAFGRFSFVYGPAEAGKTVLLHAMGAAVNRLSAMGRCEQFAVYVDLMGSTKLDKSITDAIQSANQDTDTQSPQLTILIDHINDQDENQINNLIQFAAKHPEWKFVVTLRRELLLNGLMAKNQHVDSSFFEIRYWGPSRIRQMAQHFFVGTNIDPNAAYDFVSNSLRTTDLPATPIVILLYLSVFPSLGSEVTSLSFLRLLERIEEMRFGRSENSAANSLYNKQRFLALVAAECERQSKKTLPRPEIEQAINDYFSAKLLPVNVDSFLRSLFDSGILAENDGNIGFTCYVFFDYYLAKAFQQDIADIGRNTNTLHECIAVSDALALYGGLLRANVDLAKRLMNFIETSFKTDTEFTLASLDKYIDDLLLPSSGADDVDAVATEDLKRRVAYEDLDEPFSEERSSYEERRNQPLELPVTGSDLEQLSTLIAGLEAFYKVFRNLENIDGQDKVTLLNRILDFHIQCNLGLIKFFHLLSKDENIAGLNTLLAYLATMSGQNFLSTYIGNQSLRLAIDEAQKQTSNDFKQMLLVFLYTDLRLQGYESKLENFVRRTKSRAAAEMVFIKVRHLMIFHESNVLPTGLVAVLKAAFEKRTELSMGKASKGALNAAFDDLLIKLKVTRQKEQISQKAIE